MTQAGAARFFRRPCWRSALAGALLLAAGSGVAADAPPSPLAPKPPAGADAGTLVYGAGWAALVSVPEGWDSDCCDLARTHNVNLLVFPHDWDRGTPDRVMQLFVWTQPKQSLDADWQADVRDYSARFPGVEVKPFAVSVPGRACRAAVYDGGEQARNYVAFCDAGNGLGFRYSWSMTLFGDRVDRARYESAFRAVVTHTVPMDAKIEQRAVSPR